MAEKKDRTPEEQAKIDARMEKVRAARQKKNLEQTVNPGEIGTDEVDNIPSPAEPVQTVARDDYAELQRQVQELKDMMWNQMLMQVQAPNGRQEGQSGTMTGTFEKYTLDPSMYPSPIERLAHEPRLAPFAFPLNYELTYTVGKTQYTSIDNVRTVEPRFTVELIRIMRDPDTGEATNSRYVICMLIMHEDPDAAIFMAQQNGLQIDSSNEREFLNEMRYLRIRDWLFDAFFPPPPVDVSNKRDMVVDGKLVKVYEKTNESGKGMHKHDWDNLPKMKF